MRDATHRSNHTRRGFLAIAAAGTAAAGAQLLLPGKAGAAQLNPGDSLRAGESDTLPGTVTMLTAADPNANIVFVNTTGDPALVTAGESLGLVAYDDYSGSSQPALPAGETAGIIAAGGDYGVLSTSAKGAGVQGVTAGGAGVRGVATGRGVALEADGAVRFSSSGRGAFVKNQFKATVTGVRVPVTAKILVTLGGDPGPGNTVKLARRLTATSFEVHLLAPARVRTPFSWFVIL